MSREKKEKKKSGKKVLIVLAVILVIIVGAGAVFTTFGGFGTGSSADPDQYTKYSKNVNLITIPEGTKIVALGEATHGNKEFQQLKLDVYKVLVMNYGVRAFALEGDFGGCECVNRYINGGEGTAEEAAEAIGFAIYRTDEMAELIQWMRDYNDKASEAEKLVFYGFDMQRYEYNYEFLIDDAKSLGVDTAELEKLYDRESRTVVDSYTSEQRAQVINSVKDEIEEKCGSVDAAGETHSEEPRFDKDVLAAFAMHHADILLQNIEIGKVYESETVGGWAGTTLRDKLMAENTMWILEQEQKRGNECIFVSAHNGHVEQNGCYNALENKVLGNHLATELGDAYFAIGTDFYRTKDNLPTNDGKRVTKTFYSYDPIAKAAKNGGHNVSYLDFADVPADSSLRAAVDNYCYMGTLGESYSALMKFLPMTYRVWRSPSETYDAIIIVGDAHPTRIKE